jgi:hypothetical protein
MAAILQDYSNARHDLQKIKGGRDALAERVGSFEGIPKAFTSQLITVKDKLEANKKFLRFQLTCHSNVTVAQSKEIKRLKIELAQKNEENEAKAGQMATFEAQKVKLEEELEALNLKLCQVQWASAKTGTL